MKILTFLLVLVATVAIAKDDLKIAGSITAVDAAKQQITVTTPDNAALVFAIVPSTDIDFKKQKGKPTFTDLAIGTWVKIEYLAGNNVNTAKEVDIYPAKK
ncbi:MAG: hypothetical protein LBV09_02215 [Deferribacteraceae bacterium]|jgi:hypothetical protein|nr:hypothetical protein [Deferribacteraceae bacterium]